MLHAHVHMRVHVCMLLAHLVHVAYINECQEEYAQDEQQTNLAAPPVLPVLPMDDAESVVSRLRKEGVFTV